MKFVMLFSIHTRTFFVGILLLYTTLRVFLAAPTLQAQDKRGQSIREPEVKEVLRSLDSLLLLPSDSSISQAALRSSLQAKLTEYHRQLDEWNSFKDSLHVEIITPLADTVTVVNNRNVIVEGRVSKPQAEVWLLVRWQKSAYYWVQPRAAVAVDGHWQARVYAGSESKNSGHIFEIRAFAGLQAPLELSQILFTWPEALAQSKIVMVKRK